MQMRYTLDGTSAELQQDTDRLNEFIKHHLSVQRPGHDMLNDYYEGLNFNLTEVLTDVTDHNADNRVSHDYFFLDYETYKWLLFRQYDTSRNGRRESCGRA